MIKLAVFDLDNTLLHSDKHLSERTVEALSALDARGVDVAVATGRTESTARPFIERIGVVSAAIYNNGAIIEADTTLVETIIEKDAQRKVLEDAFEAGVSVAIYQRERIVGPDSERMRLIEAFARSAGASFDIKYTDDFEYLCGIDAYKILVELKTQKQEEALQKRFEPLSAHVTKSQDTFLDITPIGADKGTAIRRLIAYYGLSSEEVAVFGDNDNDEEMLQAVRFSFAMKNGTIKAKQAATFVTRLEADRDGVADTLAHHDIFKEGENR